jgi:predicted YcjX-like family ATPase
MLNPYRSKPLTRTKTVGIVGLIQAGKTVLLTSLIDHLKNHSPSQFPVGKTGTEICQIRTRVSRFNVETFPYSSFREGLGSAAWPKKSLQMQEHRADYSRDDWKWTVIDLSLIDMPGERLADMAIAANKHFADWSDLVLETLQDCPEFSEQAVPFLHAVAEAEKNLSKGLAEEVFLANYRRALARLVLSSMPFITPSSFLIDPHGSYVAENILALRRKFDDTCLVDALVENQYCGLSPHEQFAPLSAVLRNANPDLAKCFARRYSDYRKQVVLPLARVLKGCDELVILVDIAMLLQGGVGMLNANKSFLEQLIAYVDPGFTPAGKLGSLLTKLGTLGLRRGGLGVRRITFVATKADRVHQCDRSRLESLLREMVSPFVRANTAVKQLKVDYLVCSAVNSTRCESDGVRVVHYKIPSGPNVREWTTAKEAVSEVPVTWPDHFDGSDYEFPSPKPWMPAVRGKPPEQFGLDRIADIILS